MNEEQDTINSSKQIEIVKENWKKALDKLSKPFKYETIRDGLNDSKYWFKLPNEVLTFDGYVRLLSHLQNIRNEIVKEKLKIDEHYDMKIAAFKNMEKILPGLYEDSIAKTVQQKESRAGLDLQLFTEIVKQAESLKRMADSILNNIDSSIAQLNRQMKAIDMGIRTSSITTSGVYDWKNEEEEKEEEDTSWDEIEDSDSDKE